MIDPTHPDRGRAIHIDGLDWTSVDALLVMEHPELLEIRADKDEDAFEEYARAQMNKKQNTNPTPTGSTAAAAASAAAAAATSTASMSEPKLTLTLKKSNPSTLSLNVPSNLAEDQQHSDKQQDSEVGFVDDRRDNDAEDAALVAGEDDQEVRQGGVDDDQDGDSEDEEGEVVDQSEAEGDMMAEGGPNGMYEVNGENEDDAIGMDYTEVATAADADDNDFDDFDSRLKAKALAESQPAADDADQMEVAPAEDDADEDAWMNDI
jgi:hypothetical protein